VKNAGHRQPPHGDSGCSAPTANGRRFWRMLPRIWLSAWWECLINEPRTDCHSSEYHGHKMTALLTGARLVGGRSQPDVRLRPDSSDTIHSTLCEITIEGTNVFDLDQPANFKYSGECRLQERNVFSFDLTQYPPCSNAVLSVGFNAAAISRCPGMERLHGPARTRQENGCHQTLRFH
jgi:hypothetical protein